MRTLTVTITMKPEDGAFDLLTADELPTLARRRARAGMARRCLRAYMKRISVTIECPDGSDFDTVNPSFRCANIGRFLGLAHGHPINVYENPCLACDELPMGGRVHTCAEHNPGKP